MLVINENLLDAVKNEAVRCYPDEACGFLLGKTGVDRVAFEFVACHNIQNRMHKEDPERYPRTAQTAYVIDPADQKRAEETARYRKLDIIAIVHSHPEHGVYFSDEDKQNAAPWGEPLFPGISYVVLSVHDRRVSGISDFFWDETKKDFIEEKL